MELEEHTKLLSTEVIKRKARDIHNIMNIKDCYKLDDSQLLQALLTELAKRGVNANAFIFNVPEGNVGNGQGF